MPASRGIVLAIVLASAPAAAQPAPAPAMEPTPPPVSSVPATYYQPPPPAPEIGHRRSWFAAIGVGGMGYVARGFVANDTGDKGSGFALEAVAGKWLREDFAIGGRLEAHTDDSEFYTDSSLTVVARFPLAANGRFYLEPGFGLGFHKIEQVQADTVSGIAVAMNAGYAVLKGRFAFDLRFGLSHLRLDPSEHSHGTLWLGGALGFQ